MLRRYQPSSWSLTPSSQALQFGTTVYPRHQDATVRTHFPLIACNPLMLIFLEHIGAYLIFLGVFAIAFIIPV